MLDIGLQRIGPRQEMKRRFPEKHRGVAIFVLDDKRNRQGGGEFPPSAVDLFLLESSVQYRT